MQVPQRCFAAFITALLYKILFHCPYHCNAICSFFKLAKERKEKWCICGGTICDSYMTVTDKAISHPSTVQVRFRGNWVRSCLKNFPPSKKWESTTKLECMITLRLVNSMQYRKLSKLLQGMSNSESKSGTWLPGCCTPICQVGMGFHSSRDFLLTKAISWAHSDKVHIFWVCRGNTA